MFDVEEFFAFASTMMFCFHAFLAVLASVTFAQAEERYLPQSLYAYERKPATQRNKEPKE